MTTKKEKPLIILELEVQNIKRLISVRIVPTDNIVEISGLNEAGKTTALDCIQRAIEGKRAFSGKKMLRNGQDRGKIKLTLGEGKEQPLYTVEWAFTAKGEYLKLTAADGSPIKKGRELLDTFYADNALEVGSFVAAPPLKQLEMLLKVVKIPFNLEEFSKLIGVEVETTGTPLEIITSAYDTLSKGREEQGRFRASARASFDAFNIPEGQEDTKPVDVQELIAEKERLQEIVKSNQEKRTERANLEWEKIEHMKEFTEMQTELKTVQNKVNAKRQSIELLEGEIDQATQEVKSLTEPDFSEVDKTIANANQINAIASQVQQKLEVSEIVAKTEKEYDKLTAVLKDIKDYRLEILSKAEFPLKGMSISEEGFPTFNDVQISPKTISTARGIKIETAIAQKQNPRLRSILIRQGNDLDQKNRKVLEHFAQQKGYQIWIEKIRQEPSENSFFIENGELAK